jgi:hypothetical protein
VTRLFICNFTCTVWNTRSPPNRHGQPPRLLHPPFCCCSCNAATKRRVTAAVPLCTAGMPPTPDYDDTLIQLRARRRAVTGRGCTSVRFAHALGVAPSQVEDMLLAWPPLRGYREATLSRKLQELAVLLGVCPKALAAALISSPRVYGSSLAALAPRVRELQSIFGGPESAAQVRMEWVVTSTVLHFNIKRPAAAHKLLQWPFSGRASRRACLPPVCCTCSLSCRHPVF